MRPNGKHLDPYRKMHPTMGLSPFGSLYGYFRIRQVESVLHVISSGPASDHNELTCWEHVSVSIGRGDRLPTWDEMNHVRDLFWRPDETVVQFHPPEDSYVNLAECLHLWKPPYQMPLPPTTALGNSAMSCERLPVRAGTVSTSLQSLGGTNESNASSGS